MIPLLPADLYPGYPYIVGLAPADRPGTASELIANGGVTGAFTCERDCVDRAFRQHRATIRGYLEASVPILFLCETHLDRLDAKRRLAELAPEGFTVW